VSPLASAEGLVMPPGREPALYRRERGLDAADVWVPVTVATLVPGVIFLAVPFLSVLRLFPTPDKRVGIAGEPTPARFWVSKVLDLARRCRDDAPIAPMFGHFANVASITAMPTANAVPLRGRQLDGRGIGRDRWVSQLSVTAPV
jgi:hypothetical protein